jgi:hypothetical protein
MTTAKEPPTGPKSYSFLKSVISKFKPPASPGAESHSALEKHRCQFTFSDGRQCRMPSAHFCRHHASQHEPNRGAKGAPDHVLEAPELEALCSNLTTATGINRALAQTYLLMAQGRISRKDAIAFGYLTQLLLQTVPGVRAEYVAVHGYHPWEEKLKVTIRPGSSSRETSGNEGPLCDQSDADDPVPSAGNAGPSGQGSEQSSNGVVGRQKDVGITSLLAHKEVERRIPPKPGRPAPQQETSPVPTGVNKARLSEKSIREGLTPADYESIFHRGCDLLNGKYDATPEGRREARALALDLELMKPPDSKPPKGRFGEVVALIRRLSTGKNHPPAAAPWLDSHGQIIKPTAAYPREWWEPKPDSSPAKSAAVSPPQSAPSAPPRAANASPPISSAAPTAPLVLSACPAEPETKPGDGYYASIHSAQSPQLGVGHFVAADSPYERRTSTPPAEPALPVGKVDWLPPAPKPQPKSSATRADKFARHVGKMSPYRLRRFLHLQHAQGS